MSIFSELLAAKLLDMTVLFIFKGKVERVLGGDSLPGQDWGCGSTMFQYCCLLVGGGEDISFMLSSWNRYLMSLKVLYVTQVICQKIQGWKGFRDILPG